MLSVTLGLNSKTKPRLIDKEYTREFPVVLIEGQEVLLTIIDADVAQTLGELLIQGAQMRRELQEERELHRAS